MIKNFLAVAVLVGGLAACAEAPMPTAVDSSAVAFNKKNYSNASVKEFYFNAPEGAEFISAYFDIAGMGNVRSTTITMEANDIDITVTCRKMSGRNEGDLRPRSRQNWRASGTYPVDRNGRVFGTIELDKSNGAKGLFCMNNYGKGWDYVAGSAIIHNPGNIKFYVEGHLLPLGL